MLRNLLYQSIIVLSDTDTNGPFTGDDFTSKLFPDGFLWGGVTQLLAFLMLFLIVYKLLYKPVKKILNTRAEKVVADISVAETSRLEMEQKLAESEAAVLAEQQKAQQLVANAIAQSERAKEEIMAEAKAEVIREKEKAYAEIAQAKIDAADEIRSEIINVALLASQEVLGRELSQKDNDQLVQDFIKGLSN